MPAVTWTKHAKHVKNSKVSIADATSIVYPWGKHLRKSLDPMCAGYVAATAGLLVGHPLDSMKVLLQTRNSTVGSAPTRPASASVSVKNSQPKRSIRALYAGVSGPLLTSGVVASMNFALYDTFRRVLYHDDSNGDGTAGSGKHYLNNDSLLNVALSASAAGAITSFATSPLQIVKTKQQLMLWSMKKAARVTLAHQGGFLNFYSGFGVHFLCETVGRGVYYTSYEYFKRFFVRRNQTNRNEDCDTTDPVATISLKERMLCAAITGVVTWSVIFPFDVIRSKMYASATSLPRNVARPSSSQIVLEIWRKGGYSVYFKPFAIAIGRAGPVHAVVLPIYDLTFDWLRSL